jgi:hypothetical protein
MPKFIRRISIPLLWILYILTAFLWIHGFQAVQGLTTALTLWGLSSTYLNVSAFLLVIAGGIIARFTTPREPLIEQAGQLLEIDRLHLFVWELYEISFALLLLPSLVIELMLVLAFSTALETTEELLKVIVNMIPFIGPLILQSMSGATPVATTVNIIMSLVMISTACVAASLVWWLVLGKAALSIPIENRVRLCSDYLVTKIQALSEGARGDAGYDPEEAKDEATGIFRLYLAVMNRHMANRSKIRVRQIARFSNVFRLALSTGDPQDRQRLIRSIQAMRESVRSEEFPMDFINALRQMASIVEQPIGSLSEELESQLFLKSAVSDLTQLILG